MAKIKKHVDCPNCGFQAVAEVARKNYRFLIFRCPVCSKNVACYGGKVGIVSDELMENLHKHGFLRTCGIMRGNNASCESINDKDIAKLHRILESESDSGKIISLL